MAQRLQRFVPVVSVLNRASFALQHGSQKLVEAGSVSKTSNRLRFTSSLTFTLAEEISGWDFYRHFMGGNVR